MKRGFLVQHHTHMCHDYITMRRTKQCLSVGLKQTQGRPHRGCLGKPDARRPLFDSSAFEGVRCLIILP